MLDIYLVYIGIALALVFDFGNGFHDAANAVSTVVATRVLTLPQAVVLSAFFNFVAAFVFSTAVANFIGNGIVSSGSISPLTVVSGLVGAIIWVYLTTWNGLPISSSHSLIGGLLGAAVAAHGLDVIIAGGLYKVVLFMFLAPIIGMAGAIFFSIVIMNLVRNTSPSNVNTYFKKLQLISVSVYSLGHGTNDAQKTMGVITLLLVSGGILTVFQVPFWVVIMSHMTIALGTLAGGKRVIKTMGTHITKLRPIHGFCAETGGAITILSCTFFGIPVSTTQVIAGAITGVGVSRRVNAVRWLTARKIVYSWIVTIPLTAAIGGLTFFVLSRLLG